MRVHDIPRIKLSLEPSHEVKLNRVFVTSHLLYMKCTDPVLRTERPSVGSREIIENPVHLTLCHCLIGYPRPRGVAEHDVIMEVPVAEMTDDNEFSGWEHPTTASPAAWRKDGTAKTGTAMSCDRPMPSVLLASVTL